MTAKSILLAQQTRLASEQRTRTIDGKTYSVDFQQMDLAHVGEQPLPLSKYLVDGASIEMAVDGTTPVDYDLTPASAEIYRVESLTLVMVMASTPLMTEFGDLAADALGLSLKVLDGDDLTIVDLLDGQLILSNNDLAAHGSVTLHEIGLSYTLKTVIVPTSPIRLEGGSTEKLRMTLSKNAAGLTRMRCLASGRLESSLT